jgi:FixJ family two-component response regulator
MTEIANGTVYVVDDDSSTRQLLAWLMERNGMTVAAFPDARSFLERFRTDSPGCVLVDLHMPGMSGLELQEALKARGVELPLVFVSGGADVPNAVRAVREGAVDFIEKPFDYKHVVAVVRDCLRRDAEARSGRARRRESAARLALLTQREREVLDLVVAGKTNRDIGEALAISVKTVEAHRASVMEKLGADSVAELVQKVLAAG